MVLCPSRHTVLLCWLILSFSCIALCAEPNHLRGESHNTPTPNNANTNTNTNTPHTNADFDIAAALPKAFGYDAFQTPANKQFGVCLPCAPRYTHLLMPSCSDCLTACDFSPSEPSNGNEVCDLLYWGLCVRASNQSELCSIPISIDSNGNGGVDLEQYERDVVYAIGLATVCGDLLQSCVSQPACSANVDDFVSQSMQGNSMLPSAYCDTHRCSSLFRDVGDCVTLVASQVNCTHDSDCASESFICNPRTHMCTPDVHCCDDLSQPECCACLLGNIGVDDFYASFCDGISNNSTNSTNPDLDVVLPGCLAACGTQGGEVRGCVDRHGTARSAGERWIEGCDSYLCESGGHIIRSNVACPSEVLCPLELQVRHIGQCCTACRGCQNDAGEWETCNGDCSFVTCEPLNCSVEFQTTPSGLCCPICYGCTDSNGTWHHVGDRWQSNCTTHTCRVSSPRLLHTASSSVDCPDLSCPAEFKILPPNQCCPICQGCINSTGDWYHCDCSNDTCPVPDCPEEFQAVQLQTSTIDSVTNKFNCTACKICSGCVGENDIWHHVGERWQSNSSMCVTYTCEASGNVTASKVSCANISSCPEHLRFIPEGKCCPVCQGCMDIEHGTWHRCACNGTCPTLSCPFSHRITLPGDCCSKCQGCISSNNTWHHVGDEWQDKCITRTCTGNNTITSTAVTCGHLSCPRELQATFDGQCCPVCQGCHNSSNGNWSACPCGEPCVRQPACPNKFRVFREGSCCLACRGCRDSNDGIWHHLGDKWQSDCHTHHCNASGHIISSSVTESCANLSCPVSQQIFLPDQCCPVCRGCQDVETGKWHVCKCNSERTSQCNPTLCPSEFRVSLPGLCCPLCQGCKDDNGTWHHVGERWQEGCVQYRCQSTHGTISRVNLTSSCHPLSCPESVQLVVPGQCCPVCSECQNNTNNATGHEGNCSTPACPPRFQQQLSSRDCCLSCQGCSDDNGIWHHVGETWQSGCELFSCKSPAKISRANVTCPAVWCALEMQTKPNNQCCPICQ